MFRPRRALQQQHLNGEVKSGGAGGNGGGGAAGKMLLKKITVNHLPKKKKFSIIWWTRSPLRHCKVDLDHRPSIFLRPWNLSSSAALYFFPPYSLLGTKPWCPLLLKVPLLTTRDMCEHIYQTRAIVFKTTCTNSSWTEYSAMPSVLISRNTFRTDIFLTTAAIQRRQVSFPRNQSQSFIDLLSCVCV